MEICKYNIGDKVRLRPNRTLTYSHYYKGEKNIISCDVLTIVCTDFYKERHGNIIIASTDPYDYDIHCKKGNRRVRNAPFPTVVLFENDFAVINNEKCKFLEAELSETFNNSKLKSFLTDEYQNRRSIYIERE